MTKGYALTPIGLVFDRALSDPEYDALGRRLATLANGACWAIGDWLVAGTGRGPEGNAYGRAHDLTGRSYDTLSVYTRVAAAYPHDVRGLAPWTLYREALRLPAGDRIAALRSAQLNGWNRNGLIAFINGRLDQRNALNVGAHQTASLIRRHGRRRWRATQSAPKRDVCCPKCGHRFDVRRKGLTETAIEVEG